MKYIKFITFCMILFLFMIDVSASETVRGYINATCNIRTGPGTQYKNIGIAYLGDNYILVEDKTYQDTNNHYNCNSDWYQAYYNGIDVGYICGDHVDVVRSYSTDDVAPSNTCEQEMSDAGFPSSYWGGLCTLKENHPNWQFVAIQTNVDWSYAVERESICGKSYIQTSNEEFMDRSCDNTYGWDSEWKNASQKAVAYYMDPRNFLSERYIFQFEYLKYSNNLNEIYPSTIKLIISGAEFYKYHLALSVDLANVFNDAGKEVNANPVFLASRSLLELGSKTSLYNLYSGVYPGFEGYYNFYNYGVSDTCATTNGATYCGLKYAKDNNWYGVYNAIKGGASYISSSYIDKGQYNTYLQKFNVVPTNSNNQFIHQYQTNLKGPSSESASTYKSYSESNLLNESFVFYIPVYNNMNATISNSSGGATGETPDSNLSDLSINTIVTSSGYKYKSGYIKGIEVDSDIATVKGVLESVAGFNNVTIMDKDGNIITSGKSTTGMKVKINNKNGSEILQVVISGDTSGDGIINALDLLQVQKYILGTYTLSGVYKEAGDTSGDGIINALDLLQVQKDILGTYKIVQ